MKSTYFWIFGVIALALLEHETIEALQCYSCEDCNDGMGLHELHICGELPGDPIATNPTTTTVKPMTLPITLVNNGTPATRRPAAGGVTPATTTTDISWGSDSELDEDYDDDEDDGVVQPMILPDMTAVANSTTTAVASTTETTTTSGVSVTETQPTKEPSSQTDKGDVSEAIALEQEANKTDTETKPQSSDGNSSVGNAFEEESDEDASDSEEDELKIDEASASSLSQVGNIATESIAVDDNTSDYEEANEDSEDYDERRRMSRTRLTRNRAFPKALEPVCYMLREIVNNTLLTRRGCTMMIADSADLTCESLYKGMPIDECALCSTNGCNKFTENSGDGGEMTSTADRCGPKILSMVLFILMAALR